MRGNGRGTVRDEIPRGPDSVDNRMTQRRLCSQIVYRAPKIEAILSCSEKLFYTWTVAHSNLDLSLMNSWCNLKELSPV